MLLFHMLLLLSLQSQAEITKSACNPVTYPEGCGSGSISFNRIRFRGDQRNQISVLMQVQSPQLLKFHALLVFSSHLTTQHSPLILDSQHLIKYEQVSTKSNLEFNSKLIIVSKSMKLPVSYHVTDALSLQRDQQQSNETSITGLAYLMDLYRAWQTISNEVTMQYDGVFSVAPHSLIWGQYNVLLFQSHTLTLQSVDGAQLSTSLEQFDGLLQLTCDDYNTSLKRVSHACLLNGASIAGTSVLRINDVTYSNYALVVDFDSAFNYLPVDLYLKWMDSKGTLRIEIGNRQISSSSVSFPKILTLSSKFQYHLAEKDEILLGRDIIHVFPQVAYGVDHVTGTRSLHIWHFDSTIDPADSVTGVAITLDLLSLLMLICLFNWGTTANYYVGTYIIHLRRYSRQFHWFGYKQAIFEIMVLIVAPIVWLLVLIFSDTGISGDLANYHTQHQRAKVVIVALAFYHAILQIVILALTADTNRKLAHYFKDETSEERMERLREIATSSFVTSTVENMSVPFELGDTYKNKAVDERSDVRQRKKAGEQSLDQPYGTVMTEFTTTPDEVATGIGNIRDRETRHLFREIEGQFDRKLFYEHFIRRYNDKMVKQPTEYTLIRNMTQIVLIMTTLVLIVNFSSVGNLCYLLWEVFFSLVLLYFVIKYIADCILYLMRRPGESRQRLFNALLVLVVAEIGVMIVFVILTFNTIYMRYFSAINSLYSQTVVIDYVLTFIGLLAVAAIYMLYTEVEGFSLDRKKKKEKIETDATIQKLREEEEDKKRTQLSALDTGKRTAGSRKKRVL